MHELSEIVHEGKHITDAFPVHSALKQGNVLSLLLFNFTLEYAFRKV